MYAGNPLAHPVRLRGDAHPSDGDDGQKDVFDAEAEPHNVTPHAHPELLVYRAVGPVLMVEGVRRVAKHVASIVASSKRESPKAGLGRQ